MKTWDHYRTSLERERPSLRPFSDDRRESEYSFRNGNELPQLREEVSELQRAVSIHDTEMARHDFEISRLQEEKAELKSDLKEWQDTVKRFLYGIGLALFGWFLNHMPHR